jgi:transposase
MLADELDYVIGVDTHRDEHVLAALTAAAAAVVAGQAVRANARGYRETLRFAERYAAGRRAWAIEGTGSYGAGLARYLAERGETVLEVSRTPRAERRLRGKDDALDAARTARAALASVTMAVPRAGERREALRLLLVARRSAVDVRREALGQLRGVIVTAPDRLREELGGCSGCSTAAAVCAARARQARTSSQPGLCCAASPTASKRQRGKQPSSSASCSGTCAHSPRDWSTSRASDRSSPRS